MVLTLFFAACRDGLSSYMFGYLQFDCHHDEFTFALPTAISPDLDITGPYDVTHIDSFDLVLTTIALRRFSGFVWGSYTGVEHPFQCYDFSTGDFQSFPPPPVAKRHCSGSEQIISIPDRDVL